MKFRRNLVDIHGRCACLAPQAIANWILLAGIFLFVSLSANVASAQETSEQTIANPIKVTSFNIRYGTANDGGNHWDHRHDLVLQTITVADPDLLGLQEALPFQCEYLQRNLEGYEFVGRGREVEPDKGEFCAIMFRGERFEKIDEGHFWLSETLDEPGSRGWDAALPRMATWVKLKERSTESQFIFLNTHFDHRGSQARTESAKLIRKWMNDRADIPILVSGDFNAAFESDPYNALVSDDPVITDTFRHINKQPRSDEGTFGAWTGKRDGDRIDWIVHNRGFRTLNANINYHNREGQFPSDHFPVQAVIEIR